MRLATPTQSIDFKAQDIHGQEFSLSDYQGKSVVLSFFQNSSCPFCLERVFELAACQQRWRKVGVEVIAVFSSSVEQMPNFRKHNFRRYRVVPDPKLKLYRQYGVEKTSKGFLKGFGFPLSTARIDRNDNGSIIPADFLIDAKGVILEAWYGKKAGDNMPIEQIQAFVERAAKDTARSRANSAAA